MTSDTIEAMLQYSDSGELWLTVYSFIDFEEIKEPPSCITKAITDLLVLGNAAQF